MSKQNPIFSIVIANYNHGQFLEEAIQSVLNQDCQDYELIIVDGGSTDNSLDIIKKHTTNLAWWVSEKDTGQSNAFNKGFSNARGDFFFWINSDDLLLPNSLFYAKKAIRENPDFLWFAANTIFFSEEGIIQKCTRGPEWKDFLLKNAPIYIYGPTSIFHRSLFETANRFDENLYYTMDTDLWMRFKNQGIRFKRINKYFWGFRIHDQSKTSHAFNSPPNNRFTIERSIILKKTNVRHTKYGQILQLIYKILCGCYLMSYLDSIRLKGKGVNSL